MGRPSLYSESLAKLICELVARGNSVRTICNEAGMPSDTTVTRWLEEKPDFRVQYEAAYKIQMFLAFGEIKDLVDYCELEELAKVREQIKVRQWLLKIHEPKRFGDHPEPAVQEVAPVEDLNNLTVEERSELLRLKRKMNGQ